jgi:hypothetical protein
LIENHPGIQRNAVAKQPGQTADVVNIGNQPLPRLRGVNHGQKLGFRSCCATGPDKPKLPEDGEARTEALGTRGILLKHAGENSAGDTHSGLNALHVAP